MSNAKNLATFLQSGGSIAGDANFDSNTLFVDASANAVGIGTNSPSTSLDIVRNGVQPLRIQSTSGTEAAINMVNTGGNVQLEAHSGNFNIDADAVGIGTTSISSGFKLEVVGGDVRFGDAYNDDAVELGWSAGGSVGFVQAYDRGASAFRDLSLNNSITIKSGGNVGVGTSSPSSDAIVKFIEVEDSTSSGLVLDAVKTFSMYSSSSSSLVFRDETAAATRMVLDGSGNLGIGETNPASYGPFVVTGTGAVGNFNASSGAALVQLYENGQGRFGIQTLNGSAGANFTVAGSTKMTLDSSGNLGIGTTSTTNDAKLIVSGTDGKHPVIKVNDGGSNGYTLLADNYTATESQVNFGISYSGAGAVISRGVKVSDTTDNVYLSSQGLYATKPTALKLDNDGSFRFLNTNTNATTAVDTAVTLTERMRIDSDGLLLVGTTSQNNNLNKAIFSRDTASASGNVENSYWQSGTTMILDGGPAGTLNTAAGINFFVYHGTHANNAYIEGIGTTSSAGGSAAIAFGRRTGISTYAESMRIDSSGNLLVGKTTTTGGTSTAGHLINADGVAVHTRSGAAALRVSRLSSDGEIMSFHKESTTIGSIGVTSSDNVFFAGNSSHAGLAFGSIAVYPVSSTGANKDDQLDIGDNGVRWDDIYATNGTIQTSDQNEKNTITDSDLGLDFIGRLSPKSYIFNNKTRTHYGLIAQDVESVLSDIGKTTLEFAGFIKSDISDDKDGSIYRYGLRYTEFVGPLIQAVKELKTKVETLETKVATLEGA